ncbi:MAG: ADP-ribosylation factor-like protein [Sandaracinus sp.]
MAIIDDERGVLVLRVVYDGPPLSGKTTTLRTLAKGLSSAIVTPAEADGRTLYFDWVEYVGGLFEGRRIRCQIVSVPGQVELRQRRRHLLESADAVVLVADSRPEPFAEALVLLRDLLQVCRQRRPATGIVVQANKRDVEGALPRSEVRGRLDAIAPIALTETVATSGDGTREAFVLGVRLALDRVRVLAEMGALPRGRPAIDDPGQLLEELRALERVGAAASARAEAMVSDEGDARVADASPALPSPRETTAGDASDDERPFQPDPMMPGGFIWPPVDGRTLLHEVSRLRLVPERNARGDWGASGGGWRFHSRSAAIYEDVNTGRAALIAWARVHAATLRVLSPGRALILADAGAGRVRLWQLLRVEATLREKLDEALHGSAQQAMLGLVFATMQLVRARHVLGSARASLPCTLWTVGSDALRQPVFVGLMPENDQGRPDDVEPEVLVRRELAPVLTHLTRERGDYHDIHARVARAAQVGHDDEGLGTLTRLMAEVAGA